ERLLAEPANVAAHAARAQHDRPAAGSRQALDVLAEGDGERAGACRLEPEHLTLRRLRERLDHFVLELRGERDRANRLVAVEKRRGDRAAERLTRSLGELSWVARDHRPVADRLEDRPEVAD